MINKRILVKNLIAYTDESTFLDKKRQLNLHLKEGKAKFLKHVCALSNSNLKNHSFLIVGIENESNEIIGTDFFDDSKIQNLINAYLENPPKILYENISFAHLPKNKVIGLVTITSQNKICHFKKGILKIEKNSKFIRIGSNTMNLDLNFISEDTNSELVKSIEKQSRTNIEQTLKSVLFFFENHHKNHRPRFKVFKELFVVCWSGIEKKINNEIYLSRVDIELTNEQVKFFYSILDQVKINFEENKFIITEYLPLKINNKFTFFKFQKVEINFYENGSYNVETYFLFQKPKIKQEYILKLFEINTLILKKLKLQEKLTIKEIKQLKNLPSNLMICYLFGQNTAKELLIKHKEFLKEYPNPEIYISFKSVMRILRKIKYEINYE